MSTPPLVVAYGMGVDSTAMLVGMAQRGIRPDLILFANVGGEKQVTYDYLPIINAWLRSVHFPEVTVVSYVPKNFKHWPPYYTLEENCLTNGTLPSKAFGFGSCSQKWKATPQHKFIKNWPPALNTWAQNGKVRKAIGYDNSGRDQQRRATADKCASTYVDSHAEFYDYWYPLQDWGWDRDRCMTEIQAAGLPVPEKSSCFFCPAMKPHEVDALPADKLVRIVVLEARALPRLNKVEGLWRTATKKRPGSMTAYIEQKQLLPAGVIERAKQVPPHLIEYQKAFAQGQTTTIFSDWITDALGDVLETQP